jgi:DNA-binding NarL/FixJ family response regulator
MEAVPPAAAIRILLVEAHRLLAGALQSALSADPRVDVVGVAYDGAHAVELTKGLVPDVVVLDVDLTAEDSVDIARQICEAKPELRLLALVGPDSGIEAELSRAGAAGFIRKDRSAVGLAETVPEVASLVLAFSTTGSLVSH